MKTFPPSELILHPDGSIFHLHLKPEQLADRIILVGDPGRVEVVASFFETIECEVSNREFKTITGRFQGKRISVVSTGIGCDNIDIVINELDALANIDFETRTEKVAFKQLTLVRIGTSGGLQTNTPVGTFVVSEKSIGFDGLLHFYAGSDSITDSEFEEALKKHLHWSPKHAAPYVVNADKELVDQIAQQDMMRGVTISANGFYAPQGRELRILLADPFQNEKIESFCYNNHIITNFEMEGSALAGLSLLMNHRAMTVCCIIANRVIKEVKTGYQSSIEELIKVVLERI